MRSFLSSSTNIGNSNNSGTSDDTHRRPATPSKTPATFSFFSDLSSTSKKSSFLSQQGAPDITTFSSISATSLSKFPNDDVRSLTTPSLTTDMSPSEDVCLEPKSQNNIEFPSPEKNAIRLIDTTRATEELQGFEGHFAAFDKSFSDTLSKGFNSLSSRLDRFAECRNTITEFQKEIETDICNLKKRKRETISSVELLRCDIPHYRQCSLFIILCINSGRALYNWTTSKITQEASRKIKCSVLISREYLHGVNRHFTKGNHVILPSYIH